jgi:hypothetical protein
VDPCVAVLQKESVMRYSLLMATGVAALFLAARPASALGSCYQICNPTVSCSTPCVDPWRPWTGPLACGAGFSCNRNLSTNESVLFGELNTEQACKTEQAEGSLLSTSSSLKEVPVEQAGR